MRRAWGEVRANGRWRQSPPRHESLVVARRRGCAGSTVRVWCAGKSGRRVRVRPARKEPRSPSGCLRIFIARCLIGPSRGRSGAWLVALSQRWMLRMSAALPLPLVWQRVQADRRVDSRAPKRFLGGPGSWPRAGGDACVPGRVVPRWPPTMVHQSGLFSVLCASSMAAISSDGGASPYSGPRQSTVSRCTRAIP